MTRAKIIAELRRSALKGLSFSNLSNHAYYAQSGMRTLNDLRYENNDQSRMFLLFVAQAMEGEA
jgi:lambda repressor-like predicted transcriptional regulator